jgi:hypothetical protein
MVPVTALKGRATIGCRYATAGRWRRLHATIVRRSKERVRASIDARRCDTLRAGKGDRTGTGDGGLFTSFEALGARRQGRGESRLVQHLASFSPTV